MQGYNMRASHSLLQILAATGEKLAEARREIEVLSKLSHRNCLKLLESSIAPGRTDAGACYTVLMLFPAFEVSKSIGQCQLVVVLGNAVQLGHVASLSVPI
jgi:hypothetical protein